MKSMAELSGCLSAFMRVMTACPVSCLTPPPAPHHHPHLFLWSSEIRLDDSPVKGSKVQGKTKEKVKVPKDDKKKKQQQQVPEAPEKKNKQKIDELKVGVPSPAPLPRERISLMVHVGLCAPP